jgi:hypothetical protein
LVQDWIAIVLAMRGRRRFAVVHGRRGPRPRRSRSSLLLVEGAALVEANFVFEAILVVSTLLAVRALRSSMHSELSGHFGAGSQQPSTPHT